MYCYTVRACVHQDRVIPLSVQMFVSDFVEHFEQSKPAHDSCNLQHMSQKYENISFYVPPIFLSKLYSAFNMWTG